MRSRWLRPGHCQPFGSASAWLSRSLPLSGFSTVPSELRSGELPIELWLNQLSAFLSLALDKALAEGAVQTARRLDGLISTVEIRRVREGEHGTVAA